MNAAGLFGIARFRGVNDQRNTML